METLTQSVLLRNFAMKGSRDIWLLLNGNTESLEVIDTTP